MAVLILLAGLRRLVIDAQTLTNATPNIALRITWSTVLPISLTDPAMCLLPSVRWGPNRDAHVECEYVERLHQQCATRCSAGWAAKAGHAVRKTAHQASSSSPLSTPPRRAPRHCWTRHYHFECP
ncbi:hypothetical protein MRX96_006249 [Rhipicephalus microplus]